MSNLFDKIQKLKLEYTDTPQPHLLLAMPNPSPDRDYEIAIVSPEFTALCPVNPGQPDFATITIKYMPAKHIIEFKSLKLYLTSFRTVSIFYEASTNRILDDLVKAIKPKSMQITTNWNVRGGISTIVTASYPAKNSLIGG